MEYVFLNIKRHACTVLQYKKTSRQQNLSSGCIDNNTDPSTSTLFTLYSTHYQCMSTNISAEITSCCLPVALWTGPSLAEAWDSVPPHRLHAGTGKPANGHTEQTDKAVQTLHVSTRYSTTTACTTYRQELMEARTELRNFRYILHDIF